MRSIPERNLQYPVLITDSDGGSGSGFYFQHNGKLFLVSALHVLYNEGQLNSETITLLSYDKETKPGVLKKVLLKINLLEVPIRKNDIQDIVLVQIGKAISRNDDTGISDITYGKGVSKISKDQSRIVVVPTEHLIKIDDVFIGNDVFIMGYPSSLGIQNAEQIDYERPLLRKGIVAGTNDKMKTIILDCPVYFGNSGGIAIQVEYNEDGSNDQRVIGVVSQYVPFEDKLYSIKHRYVNTTRENSGYSIVVPMDSIFDLTTETPK